MNTNQSTEPLGQVPKAHPRLFMTGMMQKIESGDKTQTRRPMTPTNTYFDGVSWPNWAKKDLSEWEWSLAFVDGGPSPAGNEGPYLHLPHKLRQHHGTHRIYPRVAVGDLFWTKETFTIKTVVSSTDPAYHEGDRVYLYKATCDPTQLAIVKGSWKPSIFQPKDAARFHLHITEIRIHQVKEISEEDALAEGVTRINVDAEIGYIFVGGRDQGASVVTPRKTAREAFLDGWEKMYGSGSLDMWVIAYNFVAERIGR